MSEESTLTFKDEADLSWNDISSEAYRVYDFGDNEVQITNPLKLNVSRSGGHRLFDGEGISHYIPAGWKHLYWKAKPGQPNFVK